MYFRDEDLFAQAIIYTITIILDISNKILEHFPGTLMGTPFSGIEQDGVAEEILIYKEFSLIIIK